MAEAIASEPMAERRPRRWSEEEKRAAVELSLEPGASVKEVAACFGVSPAQLYAWRRELREAAGTDAPLFLPAVVAPAPEMDAAPPAPRPLLPEALVAVALEVDGASVVIARGAEPALAAAVISALQGTR